MNGVNPDVVCKPNKQTALHIACSKGHVYCVKSLLRANADVLAIDDQGQTCLSRAEKGKKKDMILPLLRSKRECLHWSNLNAFMDSSILLCFHLY
jgi:ankyrin repeat protein